MTKELPKIKIWHAVVWTAVSTPEVPRETWCGFSRTPWSKRQGVTRGHPLRTEHRRRPTSTSSSLECFIHTTHAIKCWACLRRNISRVCECFYLPPNTARDNSRLKKTPQKFALLFEIRNALSTRGSPPFQEVSVWRQRKPLIVLFARYWTYLLLPFLLWLSAKSIYAFRPLNPVTRSFNMALTFFKSVGESLWRTNSMSFLLWDGVEKQRWSRGLPQISVDGKKWSNVVSFIDHIRAVSWCRLRALLQAGQSTIDN